MGNIEGWARKWLENQRHKVKTCLEIKMQGSNYYVYHSTNRYDKEIKKGRKVSKYLGKLYKEQGFIPRGQNKWTVISPRNITEYCNTISQTGRTEDAVQETGRARDREKKIR